MTDQKAPTQQQPAAEEQEALDNAAPSLSAMLQSAVKIDNALAESRLATQAAALAATRKQAAKSK